METQTQGRAGWRRRWVSSTAVTAGAPRGDPLPIMRSRSTSQVTDRPRSSGDARVEEGEGGGASRLKYTLRHTGWEGTAESRTPPRPASPMYHKHIPTMHSTNTHTPASTACRLAHWWAWRPPPSPHLCTLPSPLQSPSRTPQAGAWKARTGAGTVVWRGRGHNSARPRHLTLTCHRTLVQNHPLEAGQAQSRAHGCSPRDTVASAALVPSQRPAPWLRCRT